ncbi:helix-turn-helix domain-containing protein [Celeribacter halophilus]|uniref:Helix-turn-helix domain-containing protein n=1 Tax=Celeribacter halophilus TaxID=576117 RepID=A0AAW7Y0X7_9RHOB|nr:helix-turn-helix domain-containing protein [Celeribacter halophilus]MDO6458812.1 helix-turn-helix domain-containing protein [Celeribacter halophilus]
MSNQLTHRGLPTGMTRWDLLKMIESGRRVLGLSKGAVAYLRYAITHTMDIDYEPGRICAFWHGVTSIVDDPQISCDRRQISRIEVELEEKQYITKSCTPHSRRTGLRKNDVIKYEYGINLAPLIERVQEFQAAARKASFEQYDVVRLRGQIRKLFSDIRALDSEDALDSATQILPSRRPSTVNSYERLKKIAEALEAVFNDFCVEDSMGEMSHQSDISPTPITKEKKKKKTCTPKEHEGEYELQTTPQMATLLASERLREHIQFYASGRGTANNPDWRSIELATQERAHEHGIKTQTWQYMCRQLGNRRTALCLIIADRNAERTDRCKVRDVDKAFVGLGKKCARDQAILGSLYGELVRHIEEAKNAR